LTIWALLDTKRHAWEDNIKANVKQSMGGCELG